MSYATTILAEPSLVSYWQLAETAGTSAADSKGSNTGTYTGGYTLNQTPPGSQMAGAVLFNGSSGYVLCSSGLIIGTLANSSAEAWIKTTSIGGSGGQAIYCERAASGNNIWKLGLCSAADPGGIAGRAELVHRDDGGSLYFFNGGKQVIDGGWHHIVLTKAGTALALYVDGVQVATGTMAGTDTLTNAGIQSRIAADQQDSSVYFNGAISNVALYNAALTPTQVLAHYNAAGNPNIRVSQEGVLAIGQANPKTRISQIGVMAVVANPSAAPTFIPGSFRVKRGSSPSSVLQDGQLGWNRTTRQLFIGDTGTNYPVLPAAVATPGGSSGQLQYNNAGALGGTAAATYVTSGNLLTVTAQTATDIPLTIKGAVSQSGDLQDWKDSSGNVLARITATGALAVAVPATTLNNLLPTQGGQSGKVLQTDGTNASWQAAAGGLTVGSTPIASGVSGNLLYDNGAVLGEANTIDGGVWT